MSLPTLRSLPRILMMMTAICIAGAVVTVSVFIYMGSIFFITPKRRGLEPRHHAILRSPNEHGLELQAHRIRTHDDFLLEAIVATRAGEPGRAEKTRRMARRLEHAGIIPQARPRGTVLLLHGRGGRKEDMLSVAQRFVAADFRCIVYDARAHGKSEGDFCTFGINEVKDLSAILDYFESQLENESRTMGPVVAFGNSLGASVVIQSLSQEKRIDAAVAVAPFAALPEIVLSSGKKKIHQNLPDWPVHASMKIGGWRAGFDPYKILPIKHLSESSVPLFFAHGTLDAVIPIEHSRRMIAAANAEHTVWKEVHSGYHYNILAEGGDDLYEEMIHFFLRHAS